MLWGYTRWAPEKTFSPVCSVLHVLLCKVPRELPTLPNNPRQTSVLRGAHSLFLVCVGVHSAFPIPSCTHSRPYWASHCVSAFLFYLIVVFAGFGFHFFWNVQFLTFVFLLQPQRGRSMSVCVPHLPALPSMSCIPLSAPCTPPPALSAPLSPFYLRTVPEETFAEKLSKALESVLPMHSASPRKHRRSSLPSLSVSPVCVTICLLAQ